MDYYNQTGEGILTVFIRPRHPAPWQEDPTVVSPATTMSQRFTVSKSDGDRRPSDMQGEVNQLFEGDEPPTTSSSSAEGQAAAGTETVLVLKGKEILQPASSPCLLAVRYMLATLMLDCCSVTPHCLCVTWIPNNPSGHRLVSNRGAYSKSCNCPFSSAIVMLQVHALFKNIGRCMQCETENKAFGDLIIIWPVKFCMSQAFSFPSHSI